MTILSTRRRPFLFFSTTTTLVWFLVVFSLSLTATTFAYESPRALDRYGNAVQLQNAQAACNQRGRLIVAVCFRHRVWILSPSSNTATKLGSTLSRTAEEGRAVLHRRRRDDALSPSLLTFLNHPDLHNNNNNNVAIVCSGIQADAVYLVRQLQDYSKRVWELYDSNLSAAAAAHAASSIKRNFWNYDTDSTWTSLAGLPQQQQQQGDSWARPLGVRSLIVQASSSSSSSSSSTSADNTPRSHVQLLVVEPSGVIRQVYGDNDDDDDDDEDDSNWCSCCCIGRQSEEIQAILEERLKNNKSKIIKGEVDLEAILMEVMAGHVVVASSDGGTDRQQQQQVVIVEILSDEGVERRIVPLSSS